MNTHVWKLRKIIDRLQDIVDEADCRDIDVINTNSNTYGLSEEFISLGYDGYLDINADIDDLLDDESDDDMD